MEKKNKNFLRFLGYVKPYWKELLLGIIGGVVKFTVPLIAPQITRYLLDDVFLNPDLAAAEKTHQVFLYAGGLIALYVVFWAPWTYVRHYFTTKAGQQSVFDLRCDLYHHILRMSASFFDRNRSGSIVSRLISDISLAQNLVGSALTNVWMDLISLVVVLFLLFRIDVTSTLVALVTFPLYVLVIKQLGGRIRRTTHMVQEEIATLSGNVQEKIAGSAIVHAFTQENKEQQDFLAQSNRLLGMSMRQAFYQSLNLSINGMLVGIAPLIVTIYCGTQVISGRLTVGDMVAIGLYLGPLYLPVQRFSELNVIFANSMAAIDRIFEVIDQPPEIHNPASPVQLENVSGEVEFDNVGFAYPNDPEGEAGPVLKQISFRVKPGTRVALVGPSGSGKSTLISMIPRFYDPDVGAVRIDGLDIREADLNSLRMHVGLVMQEPVLFSGSILDNLLYGNPQATQGEVIDACQAANALEFIRTLPHDFQTEVGEGGAFLSGGQKQRLTIARAFLKNPRILILDEATAALDAQAEHLVKDALEKLMIGRTTFIIAHRLSTIVNSDIIFVMDNGRVVERGRHEELLQLGGIYYKLYTQQFESAGISIDILKNHS